MKNQSLYLLELKTPSGYIPESVGNKMADTFAKSRIFGFNDGASAAAVMLVAQAEGINPVIAMQQYQVVHGRPTIRAEAYLVRFQQAGGNIRWKERTASRCELWLSPKSQNEGQYKSIFSSFHRLNGSFQLRNS